MALGRESSRICRQFERRKGRKTVTAHEDGGAWTHVRKHSDTLLR